MMFVKSPREQLFSPNTNLSDERGEQVDTVDQLPDSRNCNSFQYKSFQSGNLSSIPQNQSVECRKEGIDPLDDPGTAENASPDPSASMTDAEARMEHYQDESQSAEPSHREPTKNYGPRSKRSGQAVDPEEV